MQEYGFLLTYIFLYIPFPESKILSLCKKMRVSKKPYSLIFKAVIAIWNNFFLDPVLPIVV